MKKKLTVKEIFECKGKKKLTEVYTHNHLEAEACEIAGIEMIVSSNEKSSFSDGSSFREILLIAKKTKTPKKSHKVKIISLSHRPSSSEEISKIHKLILQT